MRSLLSRRPSPALIVSIIALVVATSGVTFAATVGADKVLYACVNQNDLAGDGISTLAVSEAGVPVVDAPEKCGVATQNDFPDAIPLNAPGPQGAVGEKGEKGDAGAAGAPGATGAQGPSGQTSPAPQQLVPPAVATKLGSSVTDATKEIEESQRKLKDSIEKVKEAQKEQQRQTLLTKQFLQQMSAIRAMIDNAVRVQQALVDTMSAVLPEVALSSARAKLKEAQEAQRKLERLAELLADAKTAKAQQATISKLMEEISAFMTSLNGSQRDVAKVMTAK